MSSTSTSANSSLTTSPNLVSLSGIATRQSVDETVQITREQSRDPVLGS
jgi:hypothetical protein